MSYCLELIDACDALIFSKCGNYITAGIGKEVNYALTKGKLVYELRGNHVKSIHEPVTYLSIERTLRLYSSIE